MTEEKPLVSSRVDLLGPRKTRNLLFSRWKEYIGTVSPFGVTFSLHANKLSGEKMVPQHLLAKVLFPKGSVFGRTNIIEIHTTDNSVHVLSLRSEELFKKWRTALNDIMLCKASVRNFCIDQNELVFQSTSHISAGASGRVLLADYHGTPVAVKILNPVVEIQESIRELEILCELSHPYLVSFVGFYKYPKHNSFALVTEYVPYGDMDQLIKTNTPLNLKMKIMYLRDITIGMAYLHRCNIGHRDLKPANILITTTNDDSKGSTIKITDFGEAKSFSSADASHTIARGTPLFMAPEIMETSNYCPLLCDIYSFGKLAYNLLTFEAPPDDNLPLISLDPSVDDQINMIIQKTTSIDPCERIAFSQLSTNFRQILETLQSDKHKSRKIQHLNSDLTKSFVYSAIESQNSNSLNISSSSSSVNSTEKSDFSSDNYLRELLLTEGGESHVMEWDAFKQRASEVLDARSEHLDQLKEIFFLENSSTNFVNLKSIELLSAYFGNILPEITNPAYCYLSSTPDEVEDEVQIRPASSFTISDIFKFFTQRYYFGSIERPDAENLLKNNPTGTFLIRIRPKALGEFVLSLNVSDTIHHCIIKRKENGYELLGKTFPNFNTLVQHYRVTPLAGYHPRTKQKLFESLLGNSPPKNMEHTS